MNLKGFGKEAAVYAVGTVCLRAASFVIIPIYTYSLSLKEFGLLSSLLITIQVLNLLMPLGSATAFMRFANEEDNKSQEGLLLGSSMVLNILGGLLITGMIFLFLAPFLGKVLHTADLNLYLLLSCASALFQSLFTQVLTFYRAKNHPVKYMLASLLSAVLLIFLSFILIKGYGLGIKGALQAQIITYGSLWLLISSLVFYQHGLGVSGRVVKKLLFFGFPVLFVMAGDLITDSSALYCLSYFRSLEEVAIFSLGYKIAQIAAFSFILPFQLAYEPFVFSNYNKPDISIVIGKILTYLVIGFIMIASTIAFFSRGLLQILAPPEYFIAYIPLFLLLPGIIFRGIYYIGNSILYVRNRTYITAVIVTVFTTLSIAMNYLIIPLWGIVGVIVVFNITIMVTAISLMAVGTKSFPIILEKKRLIIASFLLLFSLSYIYLLYNTTPYIFYCLVPFMIVSLFPFLYIVDFFDEKEKFYLKNLIQMKQF